MLKFQGKVTDLNGNPVPGAQLTITKTNVITPLPIIYTIASDGSISASANPFNSDSNGEYVFAVEPGSYSIEATGSSAVLNISKTITQFTPLESSTTTAVAVTLNRQVFYSGASWTAPAGVIQATVTGVGGGGGGGGGGTSAGYGGGGGGGAGASIRRTLPINPGVTYAVDIGAFGAGGAAGSAGVAGGNTTFGSLLQANGGDGGSTTAVAAGGAGGLGGNGSLNGIGGGYTTVFSTAATPIINGYGAAVAGSRGGAGGLRTGGRDGISAVFMESYAGGAAGAGDGTSHAGGGGGGSSTFGSGGNGQTYGGAAATSPAADNYGAGGGGGATQGAGANGSSGICIVEWIS